MALAMKCKNGHSYVAGDIYPDDWPEGMPHCPECAKEWRKEQAAKQEIKIEDLQRVRLEPGDVLVVRSSVRMPAYDIERIKDYLKGYFPKNEILVVDARIELSVIRGSE